MKNIYFYEFIILFLVIMCFQEESLCFVVRCGKKLYRLTELSGNERYRRLSLTKLNAEVSKSGAIFVDSNVSNLGNKSYAIKRNVTLCTRKSLMARQIPSFQSCEFESKEHGETPAEADLMIDNITTDKPNNTLTIFPMILICEKSTNAKENKYRDNIFNHKTSLFNNANKCKQVREINCRKQVNISINYLENNSTDTLKIRIAAENKVINLTSSKTVSKNQNISIDPMSIFNDTGRNVSEEQMEAYDIKYRYTNTSDNNNSSNISNVVVGDVDPLLLPGYLRWTSTVVISAILVVGVAGNVLVPAVVLGGKRSTPVYFMTNLAVSDLLVLIVCLPTVLVELHTTPESWILGPILCKLRPFVEYSAVHGSALSLLVVTLERYMVVCRPLHASRRVTRRTCLFAVAACWGTALLSSGPILWLHQLGSATFLDGVRRPVCQSDLAASWATPYYVAIAVVFYFLPLLILILLYTVIARALLLDQFAQFGTTGPNPHLRTRRQLVFTFSLVVFFFFLCLLPLRVFFLWILASPHEDILALGMEGYYNILYFCRIMFYLNSAMNPILYNMTSARFRAAFLTVCSKRGRKRYFTTEFFTSFAHRNSEARPLNMSTRSNLSTGSRLSNRSHASDSGGRHANLSHTTSLCLTPTPVRHSRVK